jgi:hypothetical protein
LNKEFSFKILKKYGSNSRKEKDWGVPKIQVEKDDDVKNIKKVIDYIYNNLEEELEKTKKDYYKKD